MKPKQAIVAECCRCMNTGKFHGCNSEICKLNDTTLTPIKRIRANCLDCCPEHSTFGVENCDGKLLNGKMCVLHAFRFGKHPKREKWGRRDGIFSKKPPENDTLNTSNFKKERGTWQNVQG